MKLLICTFLLISLGINASYGQSAEKIAVPVLKEDAKIDKLMDIVLNPKNADEYDRDKNSRDSCLFIIFFKSANHSSFQIEKNTKPVSNMLANRFIINKGSFGCFLYKNYKVFVLAVNGFYDFFKLTNENKAFDFVYKSQSNAPFVYEHYLAIWHYQYENGRFSVEGPPEVKELEKN